MSSPSLWHASQLAKAKFLDLMAHELRTPLNVILLTLEENIEKELELEGKSILQSSKQSTLKLAHLIEGMLSYLLIDPNDFEFRIGAFVVEDLVRSCQDHFQVALAAEESPQLLFQVDLECSIHVLGDLRKVTSIMIHTIAAALLHNPLKQILVDIYHPIADPLSVELHIYARTDEAGKALRNVELVASPISQKLVLAMGGTLCAEDTIRIRLPLANL